MGKAKGERTRRSRSSFWLRKITVVQILSSCGRVWLSLYNGTVQDGRKTETEQTYWGISERAAGGRKRLARRQRQRERGGEKEMAGGTETHVAWMALPGEREERGWWGQRRSEEKTAQTKGKRGEDVNSPAARQHCPVKVEEQHVGEDVRRGTWKDGKGARRATRQRSENRVRREPGRGDDPPRAKCWSPS